MKKSLIIAIFIFAKFQSFCQADSLYQELVKNSLLDSNRVKALLNLSYAIQYNKPDDALEYSQEALELSQNIKWIKGEAASCRQLGATYYLKGDYGNALKFSHDALRINSVLKNHLLEASVYGNIANIYADMGISDTAMIYYNKLLTLSRNLKSVKDQIIALNNIGTLYVEKKQFDLALAHFDESLGLAKEIKDTLMIAYAIHNTGIILKRKNNDNEALKKLEEALVLERISGNDNLIASTLNEISQVYFKQDRIPEAEQYCKEGLKFAQHSGSLEWEKDSWEILTNIYKRKSLYKEAVMTQGKYYEIRDSIVSVKKSQEIFQLRAKFEQEKKDAIAKAEMEMKQAKARRKENLQYLAISLLFLSAIGLLIMFSRSKVPVKWVHVSAFVAVLLLFQFLETLLHPFISHHTHGYPLYFMGLNIFLALSIKPIHHYIEKTVTGLSLASWARKKSKKKTTG